MARILAFAVVLLMLSSTAMGVAQEKSVKSNSSKPTLFYPDDENRGFDNADPPSDAVLDALLATPEVKDTVEEMSDSKMDVDRVALRKLFEVVPVDLGGTSKNSYMVLGRFPMSGGDCNWFWIVRADPRMAVVLYSAGLSLELRRTKTNGYRDIRETWGTAATHGYRFYRYDGFRYKAGRDHVQTVKP